MGSLHERSPPGRGRYCCTGSDRGRLALQPAAAARLRPGQTCTQASGPARRLPTRPAPQGKTLRSAGARCVFYVSYVVGIDGAINRQGNLDPGNRHSLAESRVTFLPGNPLATASLELLCETLGAASRAHPAGPTRPRSSAAAACCARSHTRASGAAQTHAAQAAAAPFHTASSARNVQTHRAGNGASRTVCKEQCYIVKYVYWFSWQGC